MRLLLDELANILAEDEINIDALDHVLDELEKISPLPDGIPSDEESLAAFREKHKHLFEK